MKTGSGCGPLCGLGGWFLKGLLFTWVELLSFGGLVWIASSIWDTITKGFLWEGVLPSLIGTVLFATFAVLPGRWGLRLWNSRQAGRVTCHLLPKAFVVAMAIRGLLLWRFTPAGGFESAPWAIIFGPSLALLVPVLRAWKLDSVAETKAG